MPPIDRMIRHLTGLPCRELLISNVDVIAAAIIRIETKLMRSNGTYVDIFIDNETKNFQDSENIILSDFGTTWDYALDTGKAYTRSSLEYVAGIYGLQLDDQALSAKCNIRDILPNLLRLAQACVAMSHAGALEGARMLEVVQERALVPAAPLGGALVPAVLPSASTFLAVTKTLTESGMPFRQAVNIALREEYEVQVDILINVQRRPAALMVVEHSPYRKITMRRADHAFAIHTDLKEARWKGARYSVLDEEDFYVFRYSDSFTRLDRISKLISISMLREEGLGLAN